MLAAVNEGRLVWYYIGPGSFDSLGSEDYFNGATDMGRFSNHDHLPFFIAASCKVSQFDHWGFESLGQKLVMLDNLGAIASLSATRLSSPYSNAPLMEKVLDNLANKRNYLGYSIMAAKLANQSDDNDHYYVLLGDPTLRVIPPARQPDERERRRRPGHCSIPPESGLAGQPQPLFRSGCSGSQGVR